MNKLAKVGLAFVAVFVVLGVLAWLNRIELMLTGIEILAERRTTVGPNQPVVWSTGADAQGRAPGDRPPNIVLILADDLGWNDLTFGGGGVAGGTVPTPNIDSIAAEGVNFRNGYAANGTCAPSRAAIMSGRYGTRFGFEFTPTPPGMGTMIGVMSGADETRLRPFIRSSSAESLRYEEMGMPASAMEISDAGMPISS